MTTLALTAEFGPSALPASLSPQAVADAAWGSVAGAVRSLAPQARSEALAPPPPAVAAAVQQMARIAAGDATALGRAYDLHHHAVRACALRLIGDRAAAEDVVHDAFVSLPAAARRFRGQCSVRRFVIAVAINHARHYLRAARRRHAATERFAAQPGPTTADPERQSSRQQLATALLCALDALPTEQRIAFVLCEVEERTSPEVASLLEVPEGTVRTRVHHARKKLRELLTKRGIDQA